MENSIKEGLMITSASAYKKEKSRGAIGACKELGIELVIFFGGSVDPNVKFVQSSDYQKANVYAPPNFLDLDFFCLYTVGGVRVIGKFNLSVCTQILCDDFHVTMVINTGVAGSLNNALDIGDIVLSSCAQEHDMDVSPLGDPNGIIPRMELTIFTADETLVSLAKSACEKANPDIHCHIGKVVSGDQFIASAEK